MLDRGRETERETTDNRERSGLRENRHKDRMSALLLGKGDLILPLASSSLPLQTVHILMGEFIILSNMMQLAIHE